MTPQEKYDRLVKIGNITTINPISGNRGVSVGSTRLSFVSNVGNVVFHRFSSHQESFDETASDLYNQVMEALWNVICNGTN